MSITAAGVMQCTVVETKTGQYVGAQDNTVTTNGLNTTRTLSGSTTPAATKYSAGRVTLVAGAGTIDLTSLPDENGVAGKVDFTGLKIVEAVFRNLSTNANSMTVAKGASNGHTGLGASFNVQVQPGDPGWHYMGSAAAGQAAVGAANKTLDVAGTGTQVLEYEIVAG